MGQLETNRKLHNITPIINKDYLSDLIKKANICIQNNESTQSPTDSI